MASPLAKGLFHKAIGESGAAFYSRDIPFKSAAQREREDTELVAKKMGVRSLAELRALPAKKLLQVPMKEEGGEEYHFSPDIDGYFLPEPPHAIFAAGKQNDVPLLAGWNRDEGSLPLTGIAKSTTAELRSTAEEEFGKREAEFLELYRGSSNAEAARSLQDFLGDMFMGYTTWKWMEAQKSSGKQAVYRYRFDLSLPATDKPEGLGAYHSAEIEYVFGQLDSKALPWRPEDRALSAQMQKFWTNFAKSGDPNGPGLPKWPGYAAEDGWQVMYLNARSKAAADDQRARYRFLDQMWGK
jgi:para-nitrobenzyl esterase